MARLLVVSRSMALAMRLADDHDVVEFPVDRLDELAPGKDVEALVLDLGEPAAAMQTLERLRGRGFATRVLIVSGYQPAWNDLVDLHIDRVVVVPLPITRAALLDGIDRLLGKTPFVPRVPPGSRPAAPTNAPREPARPLAPPVGGSAGPARPARTTAGGRSADGGTGPSASVPPRSSPSTSSPSTSSPSTSAPSTSAASAPAAPARPRGQEPGASPQLEPDRGRRNGAQRPMRRPPPGSPIQPPGGARTPTSRGRPGTSAPANGPGAPEQNLFRPVVEPPVPARSPSVSPKRPGSAVPPPPAPPAGRSQPRRPGPAGEPDRNGQAGPAPGGRTGALRSASVSAAPLPAPQPIAPPNRQPSPPPAPEAEPAAPTPSGEKRGEQPGAVRGALRAARQLANDRHPGFTPGRGLRTEEQVDRPTDVHAWVRALLDRRSELFGVAETAQVLADEIIERGESDAVAVLVPDGTQWRVSGGVGLRPVERRLVLDTSHWLISEIAVGGRALLIEDTDIVRPRLAGAPLAAWRHLLAVPIPGMRAAVVLARGQEAARFTERDLAAVVPVVAEASPLLTAALQMRELARVLAPLRDVDGER